MTTTAPPVGLPTEPNPPEPPKDRQSQGMVSRLPVIGLRVLAKYGTVIVLLILVIAFSVSSQYFLTTANVIDILNEGSITAVIAAGLTIVLVAGEFDLSIGYHASLAGMLVTGFLTNQHLAVPVAIGAVLIIGLAIGLVNGFLVTKLGVNALIATLGSGTMLVGLNYAYSGGIPINVPPSSTFQDLSLGTLIPNIPNPITITVVVLVALWLMLNQTEIGQQLKAVGGNKEAAKLSGIRVERVKVVAFGVAGLGASLAGILLAARVDSGQPAAGDGYLLNAFAAAFLGSAALRDGEFHILGTAIGVITVSVMFTGLAQFGAPTAFQYLFQGGLLIAAVGLSTIARRYTKRS